MINPDDFEEAPPDYIPLDYKEKVVALALAHPKWNLATLQKNGASFKTERSHSTLERRCSKRWNSN